MSETIEIHEVTNEALALQWLESNADYKRAGQILRAAEKRRKNAVEEMYERGWKEGDRLTAGEQGVFEVDEKARETKGYKDAWEALLATLPADDPLRATAANILTSNTRTSKALVLNPVNNLD